MAGRKVFTSGEILTAADVNSFLMDQSVMVFADSSARSSAIPSPSAGMVTYVEDANRVEVYDGSAFGPIGGILQVVSTTKTDTFSASIAEGATSGDVTGLTASITPSSTSSKVLVFFECVVSLENIGVDVVLYRDGSATNYIGDAAGSRKRMSSGGITTRDAAPETVSGLFLDSPSSTSSSTYSLRLAHASTNPNTVYVNRTIQDGDDANRARYASTITLMEVAV